MTKIINLLIIIFGLLLFIDAVIFISLIADEWLFKLGYTDHTETTAIKKTIIKTDMILSFIIIVGLYFLNGKKFIKIDWHG